jgi:hypothetical protein
MDIIEDLERHAVYVDTLEADARRHEEEARITERLRQWAESSQSSLHPSLGQSANQETPRTPPAHVETDFLEGDMGCLTMTRGDGRRRCLEFDATVNVSLPMLSTTLYPPAIHADF